MAEQKVYEGRADLNIKPFLDGLKALETGTGTSVGNISKLFQELDAAINKSLGSTRALLKSVASDVSALGRAVSQAQAAVTQSKQLAGQQEAATSQATASMRKQAETRRSANAAERTENQARLAALRTQLREEESLRKQALQVLLADFAARKGQSARALQQSLDAETAVLRQGIAEQTRLRQEALAQAAAAQRASGTISGAASGGTAGSQQAYRDAVRAAEEASLKEQSLRKQLTSVAAAEARIMTARLKEEYAKQADDKIAQKFGGNIRLAIRDNVEAAKKSLKDLEDSFNSIYRAGSQLAQFGTSLTFLGGGLTALGVSLSKNSGEFDFWMRRAVAATQAANTQLGVAIDDTVVNVEQFGNAALEIGRNIGILAPDEIAESWFTYQAALGDAIKDTKDLEAATKNLDLVLKAAVATDTDATEVIRGLSNVLGEFGLAAGDAPLALAQMVSVTQTTQAELSDVTEAFKMVGPQARRLGMDVGDVSTMFALFAQQGIRGSQAGRLMASGLTNLVRPTEQINGKLQDLFVTQRGLEGSWEKFLFSGGQMKSMFDELDEKGQMVSKGVLHEFHDATKNMTVATREWYLASIFGKEAGKVWSTLVSEYSAAQSAAEAAGEAGVNHWEAINQAMHDPTTQLKSFSDQWEEVAAGTKVQMGQVLFVFEELKERFGTIIATNLIPMLRHVQNLAQGFLDWAKTHPEVASGLTKAAIALALFASVVGPMVVGMGFLVQGVASTALALKSLQTGFAATAGTIRTVMASIAAAGPAIGGISLPILALVAVLAVFAVAWHQNWNGIRDSTAAITADLGNLMQALVGTVGGLLTTLTGLFNGNTDVLKQGWNDLATSLLEIGFVLEDLAGNMLVWGHNLTVSLANGIMSGIGYIGQAVWAVAETVAQYFRSFSPPKYGPLRLIKVWGTNLMTTFMEGMAAADFDAIASVADKIGDSLKRNISDKMVSASSYAGTMGGANNLIDDMLATVRGGGRVGEEFFESLRPALGDWYDYVVRIGMAYQEVYANQRQLNAEKQRLDLLKAQREELQKQAQARADAFDSFLSATDGTSAANNTDAMVDPTTPEGQRKIAEMRRNLSREDFQNWIGFQKRLWEQRAAIEDQALAKQEEVVQEQVDTIQAQLDAANEQYNLYVKTYEYAVKMYELAAEQARLEEEQRRKEEEAAKAKKNLLGTPQDLSAALAEIGGVIGGDQVIQDENTLRDNRGGDDIGALGDAQRQAEREEERLSALERLNRQKRAQFETDLINAKSEAERDRIKQEKDAWDAAYRQEKARLQERVQAAREVTEAAEQMADASMGGRVAAVEAQFQQEIAKLLGDQTRAILDANALKSQNADLDKAQVEATSQLREEERALRDLQAYGDAKKLEFEKRLLEAQGDPEKIRRIKEEQEAWEAAYKRALEAQQARVEAARRAKQDLSDLAAELRAEEAKKEKDGPGGPPDFGAGPAANEFAGGVIPGMGDFKWPWEEGGSGSGAPRKSYLEAVEAFNNIDRAIKFLGDSSIPAEQKMRVLGETLMEAVGWKSFDAETIIGPGLSRAFYYVRDAAMKFFTWDLPDAWNQFKEPFVSQWLKFWNWDVPMAVDGFKQWWNSTIGPWFTGEATGQIQLGLISWGTSLSGWFGEQAVNLGIWLAGWLEVIGTWWTDQKTSWGTWLGEVGTEVTTWWDEQKTGWGTWLDDTLAIVTEFFTGDGGLNPLFDLNLGELLGNVLEFFTGEKGLNLTFDTNLATIGQTVLDFFTGNNGQVSIWDLNLATIGKSVLDFFTGPEGVNKTWDEQLGIIVSNVVTWFTGDEGMGRAWQTGLADILKTAQDAIFGEDGLVEKWGKIKSAVVDPVISALESVFRPITSFIDRLSNIRFPDMPDWLRNGPPSGGDGGGGGGSGIGNFYGLKSVPYDMYNSYLHKGERVLTAQEARVYNALEDAVGGSARALHSALAGAANVTNNSRANSSQKVVNLNVARVDATDPNEGRSFLTQMAFLS